MKFSILATLVLGLMISCGGGSQDVAQGTQTDEQHMEGKQSTQVMTAGGERFIYYTCPMESHKHIHSREPGACTECGMTLVEGVVTSEDKMDYYGCPMLIHSHVRHEEPGRCAECKMELKPMRLKAEGS